MIAGAAWTPDSFGDKCCQSLEYNGIHIAIVCANSSTHYAYRNNYVWFEGTVEERKAHAEKLLAIDIRMEEYRQKLIEEYGL